MEYASVNPGYVYGPLLNRHMPSSIKMIQLLMQGKYPGTARNHLPAVDVRDVARVHLLAMQCDDPSATRFPAVAGSLWMAEMARAIHHRMGEHGRKSPRRQLPDWIVRLIALADPAPRAILPYQGREYHVDTSTTRRVLGVEFIPPIEAVLASARSLVDQGLV